MADVKMTDEELERRRDQLALDVRHDPELRADLAEVEEALARRRAAPAERKRVARDTDTLNEDIDAARATLVALLARWSTRRGPMGAVNLHEAITFEVAQALARDQGEVMAAMLAGGVSAAARMLAKQRTETF